MPTKKKIKLEKGTAAYKMALREKIERQERELRQLKAELAAEEKETKTSLKLREAIEG